MVLFVTIPKITVYHPNVGNGQPFANVGYSGFIGSFSGMSASPQATSEIGVSYPDDTFGKESRQGIPFTYILRDMLQFDKTYLDTINRVTNANRTCDLILGIGDGVNAQFRGIEYSYSTANFYTDTDMEPYNETWHPRMDSIVYYGMDWLCPNYDTVLNAQLTAGYGQLTPELGVRNISAILQSGDNFVSYYDLTPSHPMMYVSFGSAHGASGPPNAYDRQYSAIDMKNLFSVGPPPTSQVAATASVVYHDPRHGNFNWHGWSKKLRTGNTRKYK